MKKLSLIILFALVLSILLSVSAFAGPGPSISDFAPSAITPDQTHKLTNEKIIPICTEIALKSGTIVRTSNFAILANQTDKTQPKYMTIYNSATNENNVVILLKEDMNVYLTNGGLYSTYFKSTENCLKSLIKFVDQKTTYYGYSVDEKESLRMLINRSIQTEKKYTNEISLLNGRIAQICAEKDKKYNNEISLMQGRIAQICAEKDKVIIELSAKLTETK